MHTFDYFLLVWWAIGILLAIALIGKPRRPVTPRTVIIMILIQIVLVLALLTSRGVIEWGA